MLVKDALLEGVQKLSTSGIESPAAEASILLCFVIHCDRAFLYAHGEDGMTEGQIRRYRELLEERFNRKPLQYITGYQEFMSLNFTVTPDVLIPRQDTETLVEAAIHTAKSSVKASEYRECREIRVLDIGTGSGCIAVSLAVYVPECRVTAMDISSGALEVCKENARKHGVPERVEPILGDIVSIATEGQRKNPVLTGVEAPYAMILSNPPYIPVKELESLQPEVAAYEPHGALNGGADGLEFYRAITRIAPAWLADEGVLMFEVGIGQAEAVATLMREGFTEIKTVKDLAGIDRVVMGVKRLDFSTLS